MTKIHFVCTGNIYRSRLAEAYLNSKNIPNIQVSSSGIEAGESSDESITTYAAEILQANKLTSFMSPSWQKTTKEHLENADLVIFMTQYHYDYCVQQFSFVFKYFQIWNVVDMTPEIQARGLDFTMETATNTFNLIKSKVDQLENSLK